MAELTDAELDRMEAVGSALREYHDDDPRVAFPEAPHPGRDIHDLVAEVRRLHARVANREATAGEPAVRELDGGVIAELVAERDAAWARVAYLQHYIMSAAIASMNTGAEQWRDEGCRRNLAACGDDWTAPA
jgi:hypothetical protein